MKISGQKPFQFIYREDLRTLPKSALDCEVNLHGGFAIDYDSDGRIFYGMPNLGLMSISSDLKYQDIIDLPDKISTLNFHGIKIFTIDNTKRLVLSANLDEKVIILTLEGKIDFILSRPEFEEYKSKSKIFKPTDTAIFNNDLYVADGYGSNYISVADLKTRKWKKIFAGQTDDPKAPGLFGTAHGLNLTPDAKSLSIADRPHSRFEHFTFEGDFKESFNIPYGSKPCGIDFINWKGRSLGLVGSLDDPIEGKAAPIYILDGESYELLSTIRPKEDLGIDIADHIHNAVWYEHNGGLYLICQAWNPGFYFVLELV